MRVLRYELSVNDHVLKEPDRNAFPALELAGSDEHALEGVFLVDEELLGSPFQRGNTGARYGCKTVLESRDRPGAANHHPIHIDFVPGFLDGSRWYYLLFFSGGSLLCPNNLLLPSHHLVKGVLPFPLVHRPPLCRILTGG